MDTPPVDTTTGADAGASTPPTTDVVPVPPADEAPGNPLSLVLLMVVVGLGIVAGAVLWFGSACDWGECNKGWCYIVRRNPPWLLLSGAATVPALILTWVWREKHKRAEERTAKRQAETAQRQVANIEKQIAVAQDGQVTERFTRAVEQLGHSKREIRVGGIYALERIMQDSPRDHWAIVETLSAFVRMSVPWNEPFGDELGKTHKQAEDEVAPFAEPAGEPPAEDVQAALTVIGRRDPSMDSHIGSVELRKTDLRRANFYYANLNGTVFYKSHLEGANLTGAFLNRANLTEAHLEGAYLLNTELDNALLDRAHLEGANLSIARGLTRAQLSEAIIDADTKLPREFVDLIPPKDKPSPDA